MDTTIESATDSFKTERAAELRLICNLMRSSEFCNHDIVPELSLSGIFAALLDTGIADVKPATQVTTEPEKIHYDAKLMESDLPGIILDDVSERFGGGIS